MEKEFYKCFKVSKNKVVVFYKPPAFSTKISVFLRNRGGRFRISTLNAQYCYRF